MPKGLYKRRSPVQEKLARIKEIVLKDALSGKKSMIELAKIYGVNSVSILNLKEKNIWGISHIIYLFIQ